ncbi:MAG: nickel pincer cofactor biosynthesis protein LarC [Verrucomicrobia bacterium]|jgi:pyridinium-3,5-bisthiocarboxylic acid mononucleotide nickel chelatase|nr:nickel pincer cofactor biosynthesis protein LarC [Verrucomicrobiota bacterium]
MSVLYYDCFSGISGDMNLAAMLDLGVDESHLRSELAKLTVSDEFELHVSAAAKCGIHGTRVDVVLKQPHDTEHHHSHRNLLDIESIVTGSALSEAVKASSMAIFQRLAEAEAHVHNCSLEEIHFHEVGATDAIVDIVGAAICREALGVDQVLCSSVQLGGGFVTCAHGRLPVPAPATVQILQNIPTRRGAVDFETTTPTGAAILATLVDRFSDTPELSISKTAYGIGHRDMEIPNVLRVQLATETSLPAPVDAVLLECSVDDMTAEALGYAMERLFEAGASDVNFIPVTMKKSRPGTIVSVLCSPLCEAAVKHAIFRETTTLGIKRIAVEKTMLDRRETKCNTPFGHVTVKEALMDGEVIRSKPEFDECAAIARREKCPLSTVYEIVSEAHVKKDIKL